MGSAVASDGFALVCPLVCLFFSPQARNQGCKGILTPNWGITSSQELDVISLLFLVLVNTSNKFIFLQLNKIKEAKEHFGHGQGGIQSFLSQFLWQVLGQLWSRDHWAEHSHPRASLIPCLTDKSPLTHDNGNALPQFSSFWNLFDPPLPLQGCLGAADSLGTQWYLKYPLCPPKSQLKLQPWRVLNALGDSCFPSVSSALMLEKT